MNLSHPMTSLGATRFRPTARAMGIDWMTRDELSQAIPPAYTEWVGLTLMSALVAPVSGTAP